MLAPPLSQLGVPGTIAPRPLDAGLVHGYPRPQLRREGWTSLNGPWEFAIDFDGKLESACDVVFDRAIEVPFAPETEASGIFDTSLYRACWYRRTVTLPEREDGERLILHFGAVDYKATIFVEDAFACEHEGGYTPFRCDITAIARKKSELVIVVHAFDDPGDLSQPRGKQDWRREPHSIWYPRTTGIWQTVWLEVLPATHITKLRWTPSLDRWEVGLEAGICHLLPGKVRLRVRLRVGETTLADDTYLVVADEVNRSIALSDPGIDDFRNELLWSPETPTLIHAALLLLDEGGRELDRVESYTALRSVAVQADRFVLNGRPYPMRLILDQGYWARTGLTSPNDEDLKRDVELAKAMGFNGVRKHQKIEDPRYLYWADCLGLLVWEEMPSAYRFTHRSVERLTRQWIDAVTRDVSHPCIVAWVPFNESWGVPNLPDSAAERHYVQSIYHLTKSHDPTRPVVGNDGWESSATDLIGIHDYDSNPKRLAKRYFAHDVIPRLLQRERPGGRLLVLEGHSAPDIPLILSEFGGIALATHEHAWGYSVCQSSEELERRYRALLDVVGALECLSGFCYTQFADTHQEANGLLYTDRTPKFPLASMSRATRSHAQPRHPDELLDIQTPPHKPAG